MITTDRQVPQSAGPLAFAPDGVLFLGDSRGGAVFAFETGRGQAPAALDPFTFEGIGASIGSALGVPAEHVVINGLAVQPVGRGPGPRSRPGRRPAAIAFSIG